MGQTPAEKEKDGEEGTTHHIYASDEAEQDEWLPGTVHNTTS